MSDLSPLDGGRLSNTAPSMPNSAKLLAHGVDTLVLSVLGVVPDDVLCVLDDCKAGILAAADLSPDAKPLPADTPYSFAGERLILLPYGRKSWRFVLRNDFVDVQLIRGGVSGVCASVRLSARYLWSVGGDVAAVMAEAWVFDVLGAQARVIVSEAHLAVDVGGFAIGEEWASVQRGMVTRARNVHEVSKCRKVETVNIGSRSGALSVTMYDKLAEIGVSHKGWMRDIWARRGWHADMPVTRVEVRFRRDFLRSVGVSGVEGLFDGHKLNDLWAYATGDWLRFVGRSGSGHNTASDDALPFWVIVSGYFDADEERSPVDRAVEVAPQVDQLAAMAGGCVRSMLALVGSESFELAVSFVVDALERLEVREGAAFPELVKVRRRLLRSRV